MSRISKLVAELCPDGVEYLPVQSLVETVRTPRGVKRSDYALGTKYPIVDQGQALIAGYTDDRELLLPAGDYVVFGDHTRAIKWVDFPFAVGADGTKVLAPGQRLVPKFAYYALSNLDIPDRGYNRHWTILRDQVIPVPPLEVQREIVSTLDNFTQLEAELEAELEARQAQFTHYRNRLLSPSTQTEWSTLGEVAVRVSTGATPRARNPRYYSKGTIPWLRTNEVRFNDIWETEMLITQAAVDETAVNWIPANCVIIAISGATAARSAINRIPLTTNQHCCNLEIDSSKAYFRYVFHWVSANYEELKALGRGARSDLNVGIIKSFRIPLPDLTTQQRIADQLDAFQLLVGDLDVGIPAEIAARRKQYEYYRDKLLTFEEAS